MKKTVYPLIIGFLILYGAMSFSFAENILTSDIHDENIKASVEKLSTLGIIHGMEDGKYHPEQMVTREQFAKILVVTLGLEEMAQKKQTASQFLDVEADRWSTGYINVAAEQGIIEGYPDGTFQPEKTVNYGEALTMIVRSLGYSDSYLSGTWPENYLSKASDLHLADNLSISPDLDVDRGSIAILVKNALEVPLLEESTSGEFKTLLEIILNVNNNNEIIENGEAVVELTLEDAVNIALENNPTIQQAKLKLDDSKIAYEKGKYEIKKKLEDITKMSSIVYLETITKNTIITDLNWEIAQKEYEETIIKEKREVEKKYFEVILNQKNVEIQQENVEIAEELYEKMKKKLELGLVTENEVVSSELNLEKAKKDLNVAQDILERAKKDLDIKLGNILTEQTVLTGELYYDPIKDVDMEEIINIALENSTDILKLQLIYEVAKIEMEVVAKIYTSIVFEYREKEVALKEAEQNLETAKMMAELDIYNKYLSVKEKEEMVKTCEKSVELAQTALDAVKSSYDYGMTVLMDVEKSQTALKAEQLTLEKGILDYNMAVLELKGSLENKLENE